MNKHSKILIISFILLTNFAFLNAQNTRNQILEQEFKQVKERYFSFYFVSKEQLNQLSKIISLDKVEGNTAFAYASRMDFEKFLNQNIEYQLLNHPNYDFKAEMFDSKLKNNFAWDQYLNYSDYTTMMYKFATDFPEICQVFSIGQTVEGRQILVAKISDNINLQENEPQFLYTGQIHGDELVTSILLLRLIDHLTTNYNSDNQTTRLVNNIEIWINPMANPDGTYAGGDFTVNGATRFNANAVDLNRNFPDPQDGEHPDGKIWQPETLVFIALAEAQHFVMSANSHSGAVVVNYPWDTWIVRHADDNWWQMVSHEYADLAQLNSPAGYMESFNDGISNGYDWYEVDGGRQDYMNYFHHCREFVLELSIPKMLPANELPSYWDYNRQSMLNYLEQVTYGFRGKITDTDSGNPISAKIEIIGHDIYNSYVFSNNEGYYYRPIKAGNYSLMFSATDYQSKTISNQLIADYESKIIDINLKKISSGVDSEDFPQITIINPIRNNQLQISSELIIKHIKIYSLIGQLILDNELNSNTLNFDLEEIKAGIYFVQLRLSNGKNWQEKIFVQ